MQLWWRYARIPLLCLAILSLGFSLTQTDIALAQALFFDAGRQRWLGEGSWWANQLIHSGGRWLMRGIVLLAFTLWVATFIDDSVRRLRRPAAYFLLAVVLTVGIAGLLKTLTNVDCPWDLHAFGGRYPYVHLLADRPDALRRGHCFPAAHASSGYALMALYFTARERSRRLSALGLCIGLLLGAIFGIAQQSRGAHFLSHDVCSAALAWLIPLSIYVFVFKARLWNSPGAECASSRPGC